ncbi:hypothetical protein MG296_14565 [Flavobacteriaceae bacterium TK19130]|nr:hypothetical protein [Thermobacterium salinum]
MKRYLIPFLLFSIIGHLTSYYFYEFSLNQISDVERVAFYNDWMPLNFIFSISIGILPIIYFLIRNQLTSVSKFKLGITTLLLSLIMGTVFWQIRIYLINQTLELYPKENIDFDDLYLEVSWLIGIVFGGIINFGLLRFLNRNENKTIANNV